jgi:hypothetical protein
MEKFISRICSCEIDPLKRGLAMKRAPFFGCIWNIDWIYGDLCNLTLP